MVADASIFEKVAGIPAVYHGPAGEGAHGDRESVPIAELERVARVYLLTAWRYLGGG
jgi:di/tripeptidase